MSCSSTILSLPFPMGSGHEKLLSLQRYTSIVASWVAGVQDKEPANTCPATAPTQHFSHKGSAGRRPCWRISHQGVMKGRTLCLQVTLWKAKSQKPTLSEPFAHNQLRNTHLHIWKENSVIFLPVLELLNLKDRTDSCLSSFLPLLPLPLWDSPNTQQLPASTSLGVFHPWLPVK